MRIQRAPILRLGDRKHPAHASRHQHVQLAPKPLPDPQQTASMADDQIAMRLPGRGRHELLARHNAAGSFAACRPGSENTRAPRQTRRAPLPDRSEHRFRPCGRVVWICRASQQKDRFGRTGLEETIEPTRHLSENRHQCGRAMSRRRSDGQRPWNRVRGTDRAPQGPRRGDAAAPPGRLAAGARSAGQTPARRSRLLSQRHGISGATGRATPRSAAALPCRRPSRTRGRGRPRAGTPAAGRGRRRRWC